MLPRGAAEWTVVIAATILIAGELAALAERGVMEVIAVAIEAIFGEIFVVCDCVFLTEFFGFCPSFGFDFEELDICVVICFADEVVAELVEQEELCFEV